MRNGRAFELHLHLAALADLLDAIPEQAGDVGRIARRRDRHHGTRLRHLSGGGQHRRAARL